MGCLLTFCDYVKVLVWLLVETIELFLLLLVLGQSLNHVLSMLLQQSARSTVDFLSPLAHAPTIDILDNGDASIASMESISEEDE